MSTTDAPVTAAPQPVRISSVLYIVGAVLGLVGAVVLLVTLPATMATSQDALNRSLQGRSTNGVDVAGIANGAAVGGAIFSVVLTVVFSILTILFARKMLQGKNWARVVLIVFAALQVFGVLGSYGVGALHFLVVLAALILSVVPTSNAWFREIKAPRTPTF